MKKKSKEKAELIIAGSVCVEVLRDLRDKARERTVKISFNDEEEECKAIVCMPYNDFRRVCDQFAEAKDKIDNLIRTEKKI